MNNEQIREMILAYVSKIKYILLIKLHIGSLVQFQRSKLQDLLPYLSMKSHCPYWRELMIIMATT